MLVVIRKTNIIELNIEYMIKKKKIY